MLREERRNGVVERRELRRSGRKAARRSSPAIDAVFDEWDTDGSGDIDCDEIPAALGDLGLRPLTERARKVVDGYKSTKTYMGLQLPEFRALVEELRARGATDLPSHL